MSEFQKILITAALAYTGSLVSVVVGYWLNISSTSRRARREHKTQLRFFRAALPTCRNDFPTQQLDEWWLRAVDDCGWLSRRRIARAIAEFHHIKFPRADWDINLEEEWTDERRAGLERRFREARREAEAILDRVLAAL
jgi:hypothetical protein